MDNFSSLKSDHVLGVCVCVCGGEGGGGVCFKLRPVRNAEKIITTNISTYLIIDFDCIKQILFAFCYFTINDFILDYFFNKKKFLIF